MDAYLITNYLGIFQFRRFVPRDLLAIVNKREIRRSLKTRCPKTAAKLCRAYAVACDNYFTKLRAQHMPQDDDLRYLIENIENRSKIETGRIIIEPDGRIEMEPIKTDPAFPESEQLLVNTLFDKIDQIANNRRRNSQPDAVSLAADVTSTAPTSEPLSSVFNLFLNDRSANKWHGEYTADGYISTLNLFRAIIGDRTINSYTHDDGVAFRDGLLKVPPGWLRDEKPLPFNTISRQNHEQTMHPSTARDHIRRMTCFFNFATARDYAPVQIFKDVLVRVKHDPYDAFTSAELSILFDWTKYATFQREHKPSHYWVPLIGILSGMRMGEIFFLTVDSIKISHEGFCFMDISRENGRNTKNEFSIRPVPIHPMLIELGFLDFVKLRGGADGGAARLFPEYKDHKKQAGVKFSNAFGEYRRQCFSAPPRKKVFHSFRHNVGEYLQKAASKKNPFMVSRLLGHETKNITIDTYGSNYEIIDLHELINLLNYARELSSIPTYKESRSM